MRALVVFAICATLAGCADGKYLKPGGYVESDIPGLANMLMMWKLGHAGHTCPLGTNQHYISPSVEKYKSIIGTPGERYSYEQHCVVDEELRRESRPESKVLAPPPTSVGGEPGP